MRNTRFYDDIQGIDVMIRRMKNGKGDSAKLIVLICECAIFNPNTMRTVCDAITKCYKMIRGQRLQ